MKTPTDILPDYPSYSVQAHVEYCQKLHGVFPINSKDALNNHLVKLLKPFYSKLTPEFAQCIYEIYEKDILQFYPTLALEPYLTKMQKRLSPEIVRLADAAVTSFMREFLPLLPRSEPSEITVPIVALIPRSETIAAAFHAFFLHVPFEGIQVFSSLSNTLVENLLAVSGLTKDNYEGKKLKYPIDNDEPNAFYHYLKGTPFFDFLMSPAPFSIPDKAYKEHGAIFAPSGHGKTQALQSIILSFLKRPDPPAMFIMDGMGAMLEKIARLEIFETRLKDRLVILEPRDVPALNFFQMKGGSDAQQIELFTYLFTAIDQSLSTKMATGVRFIVQLMQSIPGATLQTMREVMEDPAKSVEGSKYAREILALDPLAQAYFRNQFYNPSAMKVTRESIASRLYTVLANPTFNQMFSAAHNAFDALQAMQDRKIVLINTDRYFLGDEASAVFGRFFIAQCLAAALARAPIPPEQRHLALLVVDEAKDYFDAKTEKILSDARQFGLGLFFATQFVEQLPDGVRKAMYNNTSIKMAGPITYAEAVTFAREARTTPEFIRSMGNKDRSHTEFATYVRNFTPQAIKLTIPYGSLENEPRMSEAAYGELRQRNRERLAPRAEPPPMPAAAQAHAAPKPSMTWQTPE